jgi:uncharacterized coiled-coil DUF342 family protein
MEQQVQSTESKPPVAQNVTDELTSLRTELQRTVHDLRMKTKGASAEVQHTLKVLDEEVKRFAGQVADAAEETRTDLKKVGTDLRMRVQKLANQVTLPR